MEDRIQAHLDGTVAVVEGLRTLSGVIASAVNMILDSMKNGGKLILFGNGGSAADAQHIAAELVVRFKKERKALPAISLTTNTSLLTAAANDYDYNKVFSRQVEALAVTGDVAMAISTSGNSPNVIEGARAAKERGVSIIALTGASGNELSKYADILINVPASVTAHIQEGHLAVYHVLCSLIEEEMSQNV
ncbi:MAG: SIS domain-containing protein [Elusimicrobiota bacterium]